MSARLEDRHPDVGAYLTRRVAEFNQIRMRMVAEDCAVLKEEFGVEGNVRDAVTDRYADAAMIAGMLVFAVRFESHPRPEFVGMLALSASLIVSYSRARIEASFASTPTLAGASDESGRAASDRRGKASG